METTITGLFPDPKKALDARRELLKAGFSTAELKTLTRDTEGLHDLLREETSDALRGTYVGVVTGALGFGLGAVLLSPLGFGVLPVHWLIAGTVGALLGGGAGGVIGLGIGSATGHQVQEQLQVSIENGAELLAVNTTGGMAGTAAEVLKRAGAIEVSTSVHARSHVRVPA